MNELKNILNEIEQITDRPELKVLTLKAFSIIEQMASEEKNKAAQMKSIMQSLTNYAKVS